jgi:hypothetical protein
MSGPRIYILLGHLSSAFYEEDQVLYAGLEHRAAVDIRKRRKSEFHGWRLETWQDGVLLRAMDSR